MGVLTKAWLVFPTAFWAESCGTSPWLYYWGEQETLNEFLNMEPILGKPVLVALLTETVGRRYEAMPGEVAIHPGGHASPSDHNSECCSSHRCQSHTVVDRSVRSWIVLPRPEKCEWKGLQGTGETCRDHTILRRRGDT